MPDEEQAPKPDEAEAKDGEEQPKEEDPQEDKREPLLTAVELAVGKDLKPEERAEKVKDYSEGVIEMEDGCPKDAICCVACIWFGIAAYYAVFFIIFYFVLKNAQAQSEDCEIHPFMWLQIYFALGFLLPTLLLPAVLCLCCAHPLRAVCCCLTTIMFGVIALAGWVIYGWILYTSPEKAACTEMKDTRIATIFMLIFCIFGIYMICGAVFLLFFVPITYCNKIGPALDGSTDPEVKEFNNVVKGAALMVKADPESSAVLASPCEICL